MILDDKFGIINTLLSLRILPHIKELILKTIYIYYHSYLYST